MQILPGVEGYVIFRGEVLDPEEDGYLGQLDVGEVLLAIHIQPEHVERYHGFFMVQTKDRKKPVHHAKNHAEEEGADGVLYEARIPITPSKEGDVPTTQYPQNTFRILELVPNKPDFIRQWRICLVSRGGEFFLTKDLSDDAICYRNDKSEIVCPYFSNPDYPRHDPWPEMSEFLAELLADKIDKLTHVDQYRPPARRPNTNRLKPNQGVTVWWSHGMGFGVILTPNGDAKVYWRNIELADGERLPYLEPGKLVEFEKLEQATTTGRPTALKWEAKGVRRSR